MEVRVLSGALEYSGSSVTEDHGDRPSAEIRAVLDVAEGVLQDLDVEVVLGRVLEAARELTTARYAAVGVLDETCSVLERFITAGIDDARRRQIGNLPRGRGVLGELIVHPSPLRLTDVGSHPRSYGFPEGHPPMKTFLGVPLEAGGQQFGNIYLTDKAGGEPFTPDDERALVALSRFAGIAIDHARSYATVESQRAELQRAVAALDATVQIAQAVGGETNLDVVLKLIATRGRELVSAKTLVIEREIDGHVVVVVAVSGDSPTALVGRVLDPDGTIASAALRDRRTLRLEDGTNRARFERHGAGQFGLSAEAGLVVPMLFRSRGYGVLIALDRLEQGPEFSAHDQRMLEAFATSAATAIATAVSVQAERANQRLMAAENERARWARELHDETLQNLAALQIAVAGHLRTRNPEAMAAFMSDAAEQLATEIQNLRALISELRPTALDDLGLGAAVRALADRTTQQGLEVRLSVDLYETEQAANRLSREVETAIYRITQEALTNARKHGAARHVNVDLWEDETEVHLTVQDDGHGFDPDAETQGFGLTGISERVELLSGELEISSRPDKGTTLSVTVPSRRPTQPTLRETGYVQ